MGNQESRTNGLVLLFSMISLGLMNAGLPDTSRVFMENSPFIAAEIAVKADQVPQLGAIIDAMATIVSVEFIPDTPGDLNAD